MHTGYVERYELRTGRDNSDWQLCHVLPVWQPPLAFAAPQTMVPRGGDVETALEPEEEQQAAATRSLVGTFSYALHTNYTYSLFLRYYRCPCGGVLCGCSPIVSCDVSECRDVAVH